MADSICHLCKAIPTGLFLFERTHYEYEHAANLQSLEVSAQRGCLSCQIFIHALQSVKSKQTTVTLFAIAAGPHTAADAIYIRRGPLSKNFIDGVPKFWDGGGFAQLNWLIQPGTAQQRSFGSLEGLGPSADCVQNIELMKSLIEDCVSNHPDCRATMQRLLPTRVLDLGDDPNVVKVRVVPGAECSKRHNRYMALSHCWGSVPTNAPWKLMNDRMKDYSSDIPFSHLPKTFRQAILLTKKLGERFLWIDSLCIIQDSRDDWHSEASRMSDVYSGSLCTISTATDSARGGCYLSRDTSPVNPVEWTISQTGTTEAQNDLTVVLFPGTPHGIPNPSVLERAWCLQERELSRSLIQFTADEWQWSCAKHRKSERKLYYSNFNYKGQPLPSAVGLNVYSKPNYDPEPASFPQIASSKDRIEAGSYWRNMATELSRCKITVASDRLPALLGLVERHAASFPDVYAYGVWESDLILGLNWECSVNDQDDIDTRPEPAIAPTWSWLSLEAPVYFHNWQLEYSPAANRADTSVWFEDLSGEAMSPVIRGRGRIIEMDSTKRNSPGSMYQKLTGNLQRFVGGGYTEMTGKVVYDTLRDAQSIERVLIVLLAGPDSYGGSTEGLALVRVPWTMDDVVTLKRVGHYIGLPFRGWRDTDQFDNVEPIDFRII